MHISSKFFFSKLLIFVYIKISIVCKWHIILEGCKDICVFLSCIVFSDLRLFMNLILFVSDFRKRANLGRNRFLMAFKVEQFYAFVLENKQKHLLAFVSSFILGEYL